MYMLDLIGYFSTDQWTRFLYDARRLSLDGDKEPVYPD